MTPSAFPSPRVLVGWLKHLSHSRPVHALAAGTVAVTWVEAAFREEVAAPIEPLTDAVLRALALRGTAAPAELDRLLHLGESRVAVALRDATRGGLADPLADGRYRARPEVDRPKRYAVRRHRLAVRNGRPLPLPDPGPFAVPAPPGPSSSPRRWAWLHDMLARRETDSPPAADFLSPDSPDGGWRAVPLVRDDAMTAALALDGDGVLSVYPIADGELSGEPVLRLAGDTAREAFPEAFADPPTAELMAAWAGWARSRAVPAEETADVRVTLDGLRLRVELPPRLTDWLRANRADVFAGETWLWVGDGPVRRAAALTVGEYNRP